jgi:organic radical activating enzyme
MDYPVFETFHSWQGEGCHAGRSAFFIRLAGCPVRCPWCDSRGTWDPAFAPAPMPRLSAATLGAMAAASRAEIAVITGGEPAIHDLGPLLDALPLRAHIETCGAFPLRMGSSGNTGGDGATNKVPWVTVGAKRHAPPLAENLARADELKLVISEPSELAWWHDFLCRPEFQNTSAAASAAAEAGTGANGAAASVWVPQEWSRHEDAVLLSAITRWVLEQGRPYRAGWQIHKCYNADPPSPTP